MMRLILRTIQIGQCVLPDEKEEEDDDDELDSEEGVSIQNVHFVLPVVMMMMTLMRMKMLTEMRRGSFWETTTSHLSTLCFSKGKRANT